MFDALEIPSLSSWWWRYLAQFFLSYPAAWLAGSAISPLLSSMGLGNHGPIHFEGYTCLLLLSAGSLAGWALGRSRPSLRPSAQWIWVLPMLALAGDIVGDLRRPIPWPSESLFATPGEGAIGPYLIGMPAFAAVGYSAGIALSSTRSLAQRLGGKDGLLLAALTTVVLGLALHAFEDARMERWSRIRSVPMNAGESLARDRRTLCVSQSGELPLSWEYVELLGERRACEGDQVLAPGDPGPPRSFVVDRVRVINGPHAGAEGWALEYGLLEPIR